MNQQSRRPHRPWVGPLLCPANAYISLRKAQAALNILLNAIHLSAELNGRIPGTGPLAKINSVRRLCGILFPDNHKKKKKQPEGKVRRSSCFLLSCWQNQSVHRFCKLTTCIKTNAVKHGCSVNVAEGVRRRICHPLNLIISPHSIIQYNMQIGSTMTNKC